MHSKETEAQGQLAGDQRGQRWPIVIAVPISLAFLVFFGWAAWLLWQEWNTGGILNDKVLHLSVSIGLAFGLALILMALVVRIIGRTAPAQRRANALDAQGRMNSSWLSQRAEVLRALTIAGDDHLAPLVANQPTPLTGADLPLEPLQLGQFSHESRRMALTSIRVGTFLIAVDGLSVGAIAVVLLPHFQANTMRLDSAGWVSTLLIGVLGLCGLIGVIMLMRGFWLILGRGALRPMRFLADDRGIEQVQGDRRSEGTMLAWPEIRAFYRVVMQGDDPHNTWMTYTIATDERKLSWQVSARTRKAVLADHERLCRLVVTRTALPLRDLSTAMNELLLFYLTSANGVGSISGTPPWRASSTASLPIMPAPTRRRKWSRVTAVAPLIMVAVLYSGMLMLTKSAYYSAQTDQTQTSQSDYYADLLQRIYTQRPFYTDVLTHDDGDWPVQQASSTEGGMTFVDSAYQLTGGPRNLTVLANSLSEPHGPYGDVAVEVTVRQLGSPASDGAGIMMRKTDNPEELVAFEVNSSAGTWSLSRFWDRGSDQDPWLYLIGEDSSGAIHTGDGAANHLLILTRGREYICCINDQYVGSYMDDHHDALLGGDAGVWLGDSATVARFNFFTVYPAV